MNGPPLRRELGTLALPGNPAARRVRLTDERSGIRVAVVPEAGGEIASFQTRLAGKWTEILYRAQDYRSAPPDGWDGRAPLLWPAVGRSLTPEQVAQWRENGRKPRSCRWALRRKTYRIPDHGFARKLPWELENCGAEAGFAWVRCSLRSSPATRRMYPFDFALSATCTLAGGSVLLRYEATAGQNREKMPFAIGNHVSFRLPFTGQGRFEDCTIRTPATKRLRLNELNLLSGDCERVELGRPTPLARTEFLDAVLSGYRRDNAWFELTDPASLTMRVSHAEQRTGGPFGVAPALRSSATSAGEEEQGRPAFGSEAQAPQQSQRLHATGQAGREGTPPSRFEVPLCVAAQLRRAKKSRSGGTGGRFLAAERDILFVLWGSREHRYFCPEPWIGRPNALNGARGRVALPPGERFAWQIRFTPVRH